MNAVKLAKAIQHLGTHHVLHPRSTFEAPHHAYTVRATQCPKCLHIDISTYCRFCKIEK